MTITGERAVQEFSKFIEPWISAYVRFVKSYIAVQAGGSWRLCQARIRFESDIDEGRHDTFSLETPNVCAGIEVVDTDPSKIRNDLNAINLCPSVFMANSRTFDLSGGAQPKAIMINFEEVNHYDSPGPRRAPGLRITSSEPYSPNLPPEHLLDAELRVAEPYCASIVHLIRRLGFNPDRFRLHSSPCIDVIAPAPGIVRETQFSPGRAVLAFSASRALELSGLTVRGSLMKDDGYQPLSFEPDEMRWGAEDSYGRHLRIEVNRDFDELSVTLGYLGIALDSRTGGAEGEPEPSEAEADFFFTSARSVAVALGHENMERDLRRLPSLIQEHPEDALRAAKDIIEGCCKSVLEARGKGIEGNPDLPKLVHATLSSLQLAPPQVANVSRAAANVRTLLDAVAKLATGVGELRNQFGAGHGKSASFVGLDERHARLAGMAAMAFVAFVGDAHLSCEG